MIWYRGSAGGSPRKLLLALLQQHLVLILLLSHELCCRADQLLFSSFETLLQLGLGPASHSPQLAFRAGESSLSLCAKLCSQAVWARTVGGHGPSLLSAAEQLSEAPLHIADLGLNLCLQLLQPLLEAPQFRRLSGSLRMARPAQGP